MINLEMTRDSKLFVPHGACRLWPFVAGTNRPSSPQSWNAHLFLCRSLLEALLGVQSTESRENWKTWPRHLLATLMHQEGAGREHPSRAFVSSLINAGESFLDVGCGAGVGYEALATVGLASRYVGIDSSEPSIEVARELYPAGDFRVGSATSLVSQFERKSFDVVLVRHVLEHLPDFEPAMNEAISVSRRLAVFIFFLTPRSLPLGVRKVDLGIDRPNFYYNVYSRRAIDSFLARSRLHWGWYDNLGMSRAGLFAGEVNSALVVSRDQSHLE